MKIDLNKYYIEAVIKNIENKEVFIKLPITEESLEHTLVQKNIISEEFLGYKNFEMKLKSVLKLNRIKNIEIKKPTNIYYLNLYLNLLKEKNIALDDTKHDEWNTEILQSRIAELLDSKIMNYEAYTNYLNNQIQAMNEQKAKNTKQDKPKEKPLFSIRDLQKRHIERK